MMATVVFILAISVLMALVRRYHGGWRGPVLWAQDTPLGFLFWQYKPGGPHLRGFPSRVAEFVIAAAPVVYYAGWEWTPAALLVPLFFAFDPMADHKLVWLRWLGFAAPGYVIARELQDDIPAVGHGFIERFGWMAVGELWAGFSTGMVWATFWSVWI